MNMLQCILLTNTSSVWCGTGNLSDTRKILYSGSLYISVSVSLKLTVKVPPTKCHSDNAGAVDEALCTKLVTDSLLSKYTGGKRLCWRKLFMFVLHFRKNS